jgi:porphobilinogen synthase
MMIHRPRRLRKNGLIRDAISEVNLTLKNCIQPYFLTEGGTTVDPIQGFTGVNRWGVDALSKKMEVDLEKGVKNFLLFGSTEEAHKDETGSESYSDLGLLPRTLRVLRKRFGESILLFTDVCLCPYTTHGHCGIVEGTKILNDESLEHLAKMALAHSKAGADFVAPSDMMDGRIGTIRQILDAEGYQETGIMSYTAKYASSYYGPFREALGSAPKGTDRATYQMDFRNGKESLRELRLDLDEGADIVMVKPALAYLDIIQQFKAVSDVPVAAYSVSAEYEMVKQLAKAGLCDERKMAIENLTAIRRAGADLIITYYASEIASKGWL